jgi:hypothetical protein
MKLILSLLFISPAHSAATDDGGTSTGLGGGLVVLIIIGVIIIAFRNRSKRQAEEKKRAQEKAEIINKQPVVIKTYKGNQEDATRLYQADVAKMATQGYFPTNQSWAPTRQTSIFLFGIFGKPLGALTVTYQLRRASPAEAPSAEEKTCPQCAERVKAGALVCRFCGYKFAPAKVPPPAGQGSTAQ